MTHALGRHVALVGFMGAGKSTLGRAAAERLGRPFVDVDAEIEADFRVLEEALARRALVSAVPAVIALGGGAILSDRTRALLRERACTVHVEVEADEAWRRTRASRRPLARDEAEFRALYDRRASLYAEAADAAARDDDGVVLAAAGVLVERGAYGRLGELVPGGAEVAADEHVLELHPPPLEAPAHALPRGESAKTLATCDGLWQALRLDRGGTLVAVGGGSTTDVAGFAAAAFLRGIAWVAVPTTLVGQVDAAIGGKTGIDLPHGKNLVGAFHWPARAVADPGLLATLPERERRNGMAEAVKTGLLAGEPLWELAEDVLVRRCAAFKAAVCLRDPLEQGERAMLNLGHTFAHALEAASGFTLPHGEAVALGLVAALRLSGLEGDARSVEALLGPKRPALDGDAAWAALRRDKKARDGRLRLVLLERPGVPRIGVELPDRDVRAALESLLA